MFALNATDAHSGWYAVFKLVHIGTVLFWVGGGLLLTVLGLRAERARDAREIATIAGQAAFAGERIFAPGGLLVLAMGIAMIVDHHIGFGMTWVDIGLVGYALTFTTGIAVLSPLGEEGRGTRRGGGPGASRHAGGDPHDPVDMLMKPFR